VPPLLSIALPVYNGERFIADAIESILAQDLADFELVISDNASTDRTPDICRTFVARDLRVRYVRNPSNLGSGGNFARSARFASGRYFKWMAADDMLGAGYLRKCIDVLERDPTVVLAAPRARMVGDDGRTLLAFDASSRTFLGSYAGRPIDDVALFEAPRPSDRFRGVLLHMRGEALNNFIYGIMRAELVRDRPVFESYVGSDKVLLARASLAGKLHQVEDDLFIWRHHAGAFGNLDYRTASRTWDPVGRSRPSMLYGQVVGYIDAVRDAPIPAAEKVRCLGAIAAKLVSGSVRQARSLRRRPMEASATTARSLTDLS
jgi:glycosyltransferase involved in cell wall biosynthesis